MGVILKYSEVINALHDTHIFRLPTYPTLDVLDPIMRDLGFLRVSETGEYMKVGQALLDATAGETSASGTALVPARVTAVELAGGGVELTTDLAEVYSIGGGAILKSGSAFCAKDAIIVGVAAAMGFSIGYDLGGQIDEWLGNRDFDWGTDSIGGKVLTYLTEAKDSPEGFYTHVSEDLLKRLVEKLTEWGIYDLPPGVTPLEPEIGVDKKYDFTNRFPNIPQEYVDYFNQIIREKDIKLKDKNYYIVCSTGTDKDGVGCEILLLDLNRSLLRGENFSYRSSAVNTNIKFMPGSEIFTIRALGEQIEYVQYKRNSDGIVFKRSDGIIFFVSYTQIIDENSVPAYVFDNFGDSYRKINDDGSIGEPSNQKDNIERDPNLVDMRNTDEWPTLFPEWYNKGIETSNPAEGDISKTKHYLPIRIPVPNPNPTPNPSQKDSQENPTPDDVTIPIIINTPKETPEIGTPVTPPTKPIIPDGPDVPEVPVIPAGSGVSDTGMVAIYNPTKEGLRLFSGWLWSTDFTDTIKKLFQDPMQAIIGLHILYATPLTRYNNETIQVGRLDSKVPSKVVTNQYITLDCGTIKVNKYFNDIHDYIGTDVQLYLPFVSTVNLSVDEVIDASINVTYKIDVLTGTCLAIVTITREGKQYVAYNYAGNCSVQLPITSANYSNQMLGVIGLAGSIASGIFTGGATAGLSVAGALGSVANMRSNIERSGNLGSNAGAMGIRKPYLIITRHKPIDPVNRGHYQGLPQALTCKLGTQKGFTRVKSINLDNISATEVEKQLILQKLKNGIIL